MAIRCGQKGSKATSYFQVGGFANQINQEMNHIPFGNTNRRVFDAYLLRSKKSNKQQSQEATANAHIHNTYA